MGKLIMWNLVTLDGYFEGPKHWDLDFHHQVWGEDLERFAIKQLEAAEGLLFGRITYEGMAAYWQTAEGTVADFMNSLPKLVASRTLRNRIGTIPGWSARTLPIPCARPSNRRRRICMCSEAPICPKH
jgi:dihydrofolate reductase